MQAGGANVRPQAARRGSYDVFNDTREVSTATAPGVHATTISAQAIGNVPYVIPRSAEKLPLPLEELNNLRAVGGPVGEVDKAGEQYIMDQEKIVKQRCTNLREFQVSAMLRGKYSYTQSGDTFQHAYGSGGHVVINYQIPDGNLDKLDMLGSGGTDIIVTSWDNAAAPIIRDLLQINQAFMQLVGRGLTDVYVNSTIWGHIVTNTEVQDLAGSVNDPLQSFDRDESNDTFTAVLRGCPWVTFHINDNGLNLNGTFNRLIGDTDASFCTRMDSEIAQYWEGSEPVVDPMSNEAALQYGEYFYHKLVDDPVSYEIHSRFNGLPVLKIPAAIAYGTVKF